MVTEPTELGETVRRYSNDQNGSVALLAIAALALVTTMTLVSCSGDSQPEYPDFVEKTETGLIVDFDQATSSKAEWTGPGPSEGQIIYDLGDGELVVTIQSAGYRSANPPQDRIDDPPFQISERIDTTDGVVQAIMVPVIPETEHVLYVHVFLDPEWANLVDGTARLHTGTLSLDSLQAEPEPPIEVKFSADEPYYRLITLTQPSEFTGCDFAGAVALTNREGDAASATNDARSLNLEPGELVLFLRPALN